MIKNETIENFEISKITPKTRQNQIFKNIKKLCKEASNKKISEKRLVVKFKMIIKNGIFENF